MKLNIIFQESKSSFTGYFAMKIIPKIIAKILIATGIYKFMFKSYAKYHSKTLKSLLDELTDDEELKTVLSYCWGDYGKKLLCLSQNQDLDF